MTSNEDKISGLTTTLLASGYILENTNRTADGLLLRYSHIDDFGCIIKHLVILGDRRLDRRVIDQINDRARREGSYLVVVGDADVPEGIPVLDYERYLAIFGGEVRTLLPLEEYYPENLRILGHNELPKGLTGKADNWFEIYVEAGLQFIFGNRVVRYGQERRGESVPDGVAFQDGSYILYDAKAAQSGFSVEAEHIRQFGKYVDDWYSRYGTSIGKPYVFLVVSGYFADTDPSLLGRSNDLKALTKGVSLSFLDTNTLGQAVGFYRQNPGLRKITDWYRVLANHLITYDVIKSHANSARKDNMLRG